VQELAFTLANGRAYVKAALEAGSPIDEFAPRLSFFFNAHNHLFEEVAKFRAARRMWARIMREEFGAKDPESWMLRFHTQTAGSMLTSQQPDNNVVRVTRAGARRGARRHPVAAHQRARRGAVLPSEDSARLALRTQQVLGQRVGRRGRDRPARRRALRRGVDRRARGARLELHGRGRAPRRRRAAIEQASCSARSTRARWPGSATSSRRRARSWASTSSREGARRRDLPARSAFAREVLADLASVRKRRDSRASPPALEAVDRAARSTNLLAAILPAVECYATLGEICGVLEKRAARSLELCAR
jgi:methylmalonyl-CoA mutase N-terminal domain/subunit